MRTTIYIKQGLLTGLRDFFVAENAKDMQLAFEGLMALGLDCSVAQSDIDGPNGNGSSINWPNVDLPNFDWPNFDWTVAEYDFNRLFVGPKEVVAPPFASVYLESKGILMGEHTVQMRELMHELGLAIPNEGSIPEDFLPYELEVLSILYTLLEEHKEKQELYNALLETIEWLEDHLASWLPLFMERARSQGACSPPIEGVFLLMEYWLEHGLLGGCVP